MWGLQWLLEQSYERISLPGSLKVKKTKRKSLPLTHFIMHLTFFINYWEMRQLIVYLLKHSNLDFWANRETDGHSSIFLLLFSHIRKWYTFPWAITNGPICYGICSQLGQRPVFLHNQKDVFLKQGKKYALLSCSKVPVVSNTVFTTLYPSEASTELCHEG